MNQKSLAVLVLIFVFGVTFSAHAQVAPLFRGDTLDGETIALESMLKPKRVLLLSFWASWCEPCLEELKSVSRALKADPNIAVEVLTVNVDTTETRSDVKPAVKLNEFQFPVILDPKHEIFSSYRADKSLPFSVVIDPKGKILQTFNGFSETMLPRLKQIAQEVLTGPNAG
jgi:peroxiredoxin